MSYDAYPADDAVFRSGMEVDPSPHYMGDFYRDVDDVTRGVTLPSGAGPSFGDPYEFSKFDGADGFLKNAKYHEPDDLLKGGGLLGGKLSLSSFPTEMKDCSQQDCFPEGCTPPDKPTDSFFKFEVTTQFVESKAPHQIGNFLLDFYNDEVVATYVKEVRHVKFAIKTDIFVDTMMCTMKTRVYKLIDGRYAIEFQRRAGDTVSFNATYHKACHYLRQRALENPSALSMEGQEAPPRPFSFEPLDFPGTDDLPITEEEIVPILDMTRLQGAPWLQAEAAASLSKMAQEGKEVLYCDRVFQGINDLMQIDSTDVAHPTSCLIHYLAGREEANTFFSSAATANEQMLLHKILTKVSSSETHPQVRVKLAQALSLALEKQNEGSLSDAQAAALLAAIGNILRTQDATWGNQVIGSIQKAHTTLSGRCDVRAATCASSPQVACA